MRVTGPATAVTVPARFRLSAPETPVGAAHVSPTTPATTNRRAFFKRRSRATDRRRGRLTQPTLPPRCPRQATVRELVNLKGKASRVHASKFPPHSSCNFLIPQILSRMPIPFSDSKMAIRLPGWHHTRDKTGAWNTEIRGKRLLLGGGRESSNLRKTPLRGVIPPERLENKGNLHSTRKWSHVKSILFISFPWELLLAGDQLRGRPRRFLS